MAAKTNLNHRGNSKPRQQTGGDNIRSDDNFRKFIKDGDVIREAMNAQIILSASGLAAPKGSHNPINDTTRSSNFYPPYANDYDGDDQYLKQR